MIMVSVEGLQIVHNTKTTDILLDVQFILFLQQQIYLLIDCCLFRLVNQFVFLSVNQLSEVGTGHMLRRSKHVPSGSTHVVSCTDHPAQKTGLCVLPGH